MLTIYSHRLPHGQAELIDGHFVPCFEQPERANLVDAVGINAVNVLQGFEEG